MTPARMFAAVASLAALVALPACVAEPDYYGGRGYAPRYAPRYAPAPYWTPGYGSPGYRGGYAGPDYGRPNYAPPSSRGQMQRPPPGPAPRAAAPPLLRDRYVPRGGSRGPARVEQGAD